MLQATVAAGQSGPVITLSGEADLTNAAQLGALLTAQLPDGNQDLTIDVSGLRFADTASIRVLVLAARAMKERGGRLVLMRPQRAVGRILALLGVDQMFTVREETSGPPESDGRARSSHAGTISHGTGQGLRTDTP
jgi:anti-sigma B factor antagonist